MIIKQQINHGDIKKVCHLHNDIFHSPGHTLSLLLYHLRCAVKSIKLGTRQMKIFCKYACFGVSRYVKGGRKFHKIPLNTIAFLDSNVCVNNPY